jgi:DNA-binding LytR/AlgR family response regulator
MIRIGQKIASVAIERVAYFFSENKLTFLVTNDGKKYPVDHTLETIEEQIDPNIFYRVNRQFIVGFTAIHEMHPYFKGRMKLKLKPDADHEIVVSSDKTPDFKNWLDK